MKQENNDPGYIAALFAEKATGLGYHLDFSLKSLSEQVEGLFESPMFSTDDGPARWRDEAGLEAYVGETLRRLFDGEWRGEFRRDSAGRNFYTCMVTFGEFEYYPSHYIAYRVSNGKEDTGTFAEHLERILPPIAKRVKSQ